MLVQREKPDLNAFTDIRNVTHFASAAIEIVDELEDNARPSSNELHTMRIKCVYFVDRRERAAY